ncbi:MAG: adenosylcobinamide-phosphate synthase CbiB [Candidatus Methanomethylophilaceae archaeon]|nr:adenosylcobinamide-phosphate synthase CbiB [Candidatus Methanomethylophilaceae archaeon]
MIALALAIDAVVGEVPNRIHPLRWMGNVLAFLDRRIKRTTRRRTALKGFLSYVLVLLLFGGSAVAITALTKHYLGEIAWIIVTAVMMKMVFAVFSFRKHCKPIVRDLREGRIEEAAAKTQMIVSRNTRGMDAEHIASSCTESISENYADSVVSPMLYFGLMGVFGGFLFRCANLMDAMWGYRNEKYGDLGFFPAKLDDVLGYVPARICPVFVSIAAFLLRMNYRDVLASAKRESVKTPSPNSGWPMGAFVGALGITMEKKDVYVMGSGPMPTGEDIMRCCRLVELSSVVFLLLVSMPLYAFLGIHIQVWVETILTGLIF